MCPDIKPYRTSHAEMDEGGRRVQQGPRPLSNQQHVSLRLKYAMYVVGGMEDRFGYFICGNGGAQACVGSVDVII